MGGHPIGRQPFRPGQWSRYQSSGSINIYHKEVHNNYGGIFPMNYGMYGNYGYYGNYNPGLTAGEKWMLALGGIGAIGGAILGALNPAENQKVEDPKTPAREEKADDPANTNPTNGLTKDDIREIVQNEIAKVSKEHQKALDEIARMKEAAKEKYPTQNDYVSGAREVKTEKTTTYTVKATKNADGTITGDTGYNIVAGKYKSKDGTPLTNSEIKAIASQIFDGKALKVGTIELPNEIEVNGKTYLINPEGEVKPSTYTLGNHDVYQSGAKQVGSYWIATLNGKDLEGQYATEAEAKAAADKAAQEQSSNE